MIAEAGGEVFTFPTSYAQQRLWFLDQLEPATALYSVAEAFRLRGRLDVGVLERSLNEIVQRHEALRTTFESRDGEPFQVSPLSFRSLVPSCRRFTPSSRSQGEGSPSTTECRKPEAL